MSTISLSMIVKNEEKYLQECLESVKDIVDEIVIVDTGSTDKTLEIAKQFSSKILHFNWINNFSAARNFALSKSTCDWILYLDADERLSNNSINELKKIISSNENLGVKCSVISLDDRKGISQSMKYARLFRNNKSIKFSGKVHEQIENSLLKNNYKIVDSEIKIFHMGYNVSNDEIKIKAKRNLELLLEEFNTNKSSYISYQIANSYLILEDSTNSIKYYKKALEDLKLKNEFKEVCYLQLADFEMRNNNLFAAKNYIDKGVELNPNQSLLNIIAAQVYAKMNDKKALNFCKNAFDSNSERKLNFNKISEQEIYTDDKKLIYEGIIISLQFNDQDSLNYFSNKLSEINSEEIKYLNNIISNEFYKDEILGLSNFIDQNNINNYLKIFDFVKNNDLKLELYSNLYDRFFDNSKYLNDFGAFLITINQINEAKIIFESALSNPEIEDSIIFYLASIYISSNEINKLEKLQIIINNKLFSSSNSYSKEKFKILAEKITPLLK
ncbi:MAG: glycosyltransferase family 2 protein [Ignavibacteriae bacterium]|nr:glycosyltransferase family 2 protein [Ignavibacteriota bacterium]